MTARSAPVDPYVPGRGDASYEARHYELDLDYSVATNALRASARIELQTREALPDLTLDLAGLRVAKVTVDGRPARWRHRGAKLAVTPAAPVPAGATALVEVRYGGRPGPTSSPWGPVGWEELDDGVLVAAQPSGACTWFPCNDLPSQKASFRIAVGVDHPYRVVANGVLAGVRRHGSAATWTYEQVEPMAPYLAVVHVGRYEERVLALDPVPIRVVSRAGDGARVDAAFRSQAAMMALFVDRFGPYPFAAGYTVVVCPQPLEIPLEAQGVSVFGTNHLSGGDERLVAHELAHQWFGNSVTAGAWRDIWLHEGFACYAEWLWSEHGGGPSADALARRHHDRLRDLPQDLLLADPGPDDMFDDRVYKRGALTLHELRRSLGDDRFFGLLRHWTATHRHASASTAEFMALAAEVAGGSLDAFFDPWLREGALPSLSPG